MAIEQKVDKLEEALMRLAYIQQKTEMELQSFKDEMLDFKNEMKVFKDEMLDFKEWSKKNIESLNRQWGNLANRMGTLVEDIFFPSMDQTIERYFHIRCDILERNKRIRKDDKSLEIDIMAILKKAKQAFIVEVKSNPDRTEYIEGFLEKLDKITQFLPELEEYTLIGIYAGLDMSKETVHLLTKKRIYAMVFKGDILEIVNFEEFSGVRS